MSGKYDIKEHLIVALDYPTPEEALGAAQELKGIIQYVKIGNQLFTAAGPDIVRKIIGLGFKVFLDLKFHDIPNTVASAGLEAAKLGVFMFNVHISGGLEMMRMTADKVKEYADKSNIIRPLILGVTVLTSLGDDDLKSIGIKNGVMGQVESLSLLAQRAGLDGVVASAREIEIIRHSCGDDFVIVTPGIRPAGSGADDQKRTMSAVEALDTGADYIVVGRPVTGAKDKASAVRHLLE